MGYVFIRGLPQLSWQFLSTVQSARKGTFGILGNIVNTLYIIVITLITVSYTHLKPKFQAYAKSLVVDPWGNVIAKASDQPCVITAEIDLDYLERVRRQVFTLENRRGDVYQLRRMPAE